MMAILLDWIACYDDLSLVHDQVKSANHPTVLPKVPRH